MLLDFSFLEKLGTFFLYLHSALTEHQMKRFAPVCLVAWRDADCFLLYFLYFFLYLQDQN